MTIAWQEISLPSASQWSDVAAGGGAIVAVANATSAAARTVDGLSWVATTMPVSSNWKKIAFGADTFVAVSGNAFAVSTDAGETWLNIGVPAFFVGQTVGALTYGAGVFVALSWGGIAGTSVDGVNWIERACPAISYTDAVYGGDRFVAIAEYSGSVTPTAVSTDGGLTWVAYSEPAGYGRASVAYGNSVFVSVDWNDTLSWSSDGQTWVAVAVPGTSFEKGAIDFGGGQFVAVKRGRRDVYTSIDGAAWEVSVDALPVTSNKYWLSLTAWLDGFATLAQYENIGAFGGVPPAAPSAFWTLRIRTLEII